MPAVVGDVFGLGDVYIRQVSPVTVGIDTSGNFITESGWSDLRSHGWFGGGSLTVTVDRIDFSNDSATASPRGSLTRYRNRLAATGNSNYGWFGGGFDSVDSSFFSRIDRTDFSNDSLTTSSRGLLSSSRFALSATGNSNFGWFGGGFNPATVSTVDRIDFFNDSVTASVRGPLSLARGYSTATGNSNYGWFGGGFNPTPAAVTTVDRIDFSNDAATASPRGTLTLATTQFAATGNSNYGWFGGGTVAPVYYSTIQRIDFSNDSVTASVRGSLNAPAGRSGPAATGNSNYGWFGGGYVFPGTTFSIVDRIDFSNDSATASTRGSLSAARDNLGATSGQAKSSSILLQKTGNFGWFGGSGPSSTVDRVDFSNDSATASVRGPLQSTARDYLTATGNSNYGWFGGGITPTPAAVTTVDRIDFSNDLATGTMRGPLSSARQGSASVSNSNYGWIGKGATPTNTTTTIFRINFSNDLNITSQRTSFPTFRYLLAATGNSDFGWFGGGDSGGFTSTQVERINFSNDNTSPLTRGPMYSTNRHAATGNSNYGWFGGGYSGGYSRAVDRIDFTNDSVAASPRAFLSDFRSDLAATGNSNYGWFGGGFYPSTVSTVDRIIFANDSVSASPRGSLTSIKSKISATSNTPIG